MPPIHEAVADAPCFLTAEPIPDGVAYTVTFAGKVAFNGEELAGVMSKPLAPVLEVPFDSGDVARGVKAQTYPDSRLVRAAGVFGQASRGQLRSMKADLKGIAASILPSGPTRRIETVVHLFGDDLADLWARDEIGRMKPSELKELCDLSAIEVDEQLLWRLKGSRRNNHFLHDELLAANGVDPDGLIATLKDIVFVRKTLLGQRHIDNALIPRVDLPARLAETLPYLELIKRVQPVKNQPHRSDESPFVMVEDPSVADRWRVGLRDSAAPEHVVVPVIRWATERRSPLLYRSRFLFEGGRTAYDPFANRILHVSSVAGVALLADGMESDLLRRPLDDLAGRNSYAPWRSGELSAKYAGALPALLGSKAVNAAIFGTDSFRALEETAHRLRSPY